MWIFKKKRKPDPKGCIMLKCTHCGSQVMGYPEVLELYCPFCGQELYIKAGDYKDLYEKFSKET